MSALDPVPPTQLAELLMSAAAQLVETTPNRTALASMTGVESCLTDASARGWLWTIPQVSRWWQYAPRRVGS